MKTPKVSTRPVGPARPQYFSVLLNGKSVSEIRFPAANPYLKDKTLAELAELEVKRILE